MEEQQENEPLQTDTPDDTNTPILSHGRQRRRSISDDLRGRIVDAFLNDMDSDVIASAFGIPDSTVRGIIHTYNTENRVTAKRLDVHD